MLYSAVVLCSTTLYCGSIASKCLWSRPEENREPGDNPGRFSPLYRATKVPFKPLGSLTPPEGGTSRTTSEPEDLLAGPHHDFAQLGEADCPARTGWVSERLFALTRFRRAALEPSVSPLRAGENRRHFCLRISPANAPWLALFDSEQISTNEHYPP